MTTIMNSVSEPTEEMIEKVKAAAQPPGIFHCV